MHHPKTRLAGPAALALAALASLTPPAQALVVLWSGGDYFSEPRPAVIDAGSVLFGLTGAAKYLDGGLINNGSILWQTSDPLNFAGADSLINNGLFDQQVDGSFRLWNGVGLFDNRGTLGKSGGDADLVIRTPLINRVGALLLADSGRIVYGNDSTFEAGSRLLGAGWHVFSSGNDTFSFGGDFVGNGRVLFEAGTYLATAPTRPLSPLVTFSGGTFRGSWGVASDSVMRATAGGSKYIQGAFTNEGSVVWATSDPLNFAGAGSLLNRGLFDQQADGSFRLWNGGAVFDNAGTLRKSAGEGDLYINMPLVNRAGAALESDSGRIVYAYDSTFEVGSRLLGPGWHVFSSGNDTFSFGGDFVGNGRVLFEAGTYLATAPTRPLSPLVTFSGGTFRGSWGVASDSVMRATAGGSKYIQGAFTNEGSVVWATSDPLNFAGAGSLLNRGLFDQQADGSFRLWNGGAVFDNAGTLRKSAGEGDLYINMPLVNRAGAVVEADSGRIVYAYDSTFEVGSRLLGPGWHVFSSGNDTFSFGGDFVGNGRVLFEAGTYLATAPTRPLSPLVTFSGGSFRGTWGVASNTTMLATSGGAKYIEGPFTNEGTIVWFTTNTLNFTGAGNLVNRGLFDQQADGSLRLWNGGAVFDNVGTLRKTGGEGDFFIAMPLRNTGAIESRSGTIVLPNDWTNVGVLRGTATYRTNTLTNAGTVTPGESSDPDIAQLLISGSLVQASSGRLTFEVGTAGVSDLLNVSGHVGFAGTLQVVNFEGYQPSVGDTFLVMNFAGFSGAFADVEEVGFGAGVVFEALYSARQLELRVAAVPEPGTWAMLLAGASLLAWRRQRQG